MVTAYSATAANRGGTTPVTTQGENARQIEGKMEIEAKGGAAVSDIGEALKT